MCKLELIRYGFAKIDLPDALTEVTVCCMDFLRVDEFAIGSNDVELVLVNGDLQLVVGTGMDEVDPYPFLAVLCLEHLKWSKGFLAGLLIGVQILSRLHLATKRVPARTTSRLDDLRRVAEGPAFVIEDDGIAAPWNDAGVSVHDEQDVHPLGVPVADHDMVRVFLCLSHCLNVMF